jgi:acetate kinase
VRDAHDRILVVNAGSSSIKVAVYATAGSAPASSLVPVLRGSVTRIGLGAQLRVSRPGSGESAAAAQRDLPEVGSHAAAVDVLLSEVEREAAGPLAAVGHRVVHGGTEFSRPAELTPEVLEALRALVPLAPLHQPYNVGAIEAIADRRPDLPQVACFDTAFHRTQPDVAQRLPLPRRYWDVGLRRYGFHGLSYEYIVEELPRVSGAGLPPRLVVLHLGNGASMCAVRDGRSVATTMGFSTLDGIPMGTRPGCIDPGVLLHLMRTEGLGHDGLEELLYRRSGLLGLSGKSADMRDLLADPGEAAREAIELYGYRIARELGSLAAALGGLDAMVFTGGIGENAAPVRADVCRRSAWLGLGLDAPANDAGAARISTPASAVSAWVIPTDEELVIARHTRRVLRVGG